MSPDGLVGEEEEEAEASVVVHKPEKCPEEEERPQVADGEAARSLGGPETLPGWSAANGREEAKASQGP